MNLFTKRDVEFEFPNSKMDLTPGGFNELWIGCISIRTANRLLKERSYLVKAIYKGAMHIAIGKPDNDSTEWPKIISETSAKQTLIEYMKMKIEDGDYHAVADAANDLRVLEAQGVQKSADGEGA